MIIEKCYKIFRAAVSGESKEIVETFAYFTGREMIATNGRMLAIVPVRADDGDVPGLVSRKALEEARKLDRKGKEIQVLLQETDQKIGQDITIKRVVDLAYPFQKIEKTMQDAEDAISLTEISLDPDLLVRLADAMGTRGAVKLRVCGRGQPIEVIPLEGDRLSRGLLMPISPTA